MLVCNGLAVFFYASRTSYCSYFLTISPSRHETSILNAAVLASPLANFLFLDRFQDFHFWLTYPNFQFRALYILMWRVVYFFFAVARHV